MKFYCEEDGELDSANVHTCEEGTNYYICPVCEKPVTFNVEETEE
jgi:hypothetical protein